jgi:hypothetical protein
MTASSAIFIFLRFLIIENDVVRALSGIVEQAVSCGTSRGTNRCFLSLEHCAASLSDACYPLNDNQDLLAGIR